VTFPIFAAMSVRASDWRKRTPCRPARKPAKTKLRDEEHRYIVAPEFAQMATEILTETSDAGGVFNILGDWSNRAGRDDPKTMEKFEHGEKVIEAPKRIAVPRSQLA
jgi:hypothetical protein